MFEHRHQPLIPIKAFIRRQLSFALVALSIIMGSLIIGMVGYHTLEGFSWIDALLNAAMLLGGMGPVNPLSTTPGKIFASMYALYSGVIFLVVAGILISPAFHRILHRFHLESNKRDSNNE